MHIDKSIEDPIRLGEQLGCSPPTFYILSCPVQRHLFRVLIQSHKIKKNTHK